MGRPNVGKSALFNRIAGASVAVVFDQPGVTRDRLYTRAFWGDKEFVMIDTGEAGRAWGAGREGGARGRYVRTACEDRMWGGRLTGEGMRVV
mgnify:CR=1 FL=1